MKEPKNSGSRRTVCCPPVIGDMLRGRRIEMMEQCMAAGTPPLP